MVSIQIMSIFLVVLGISISLTIAGVIDTSEFLTPHEIDETSLKIRPFHLYRHDDSEDNDEQQNAKRALPIEGILIGKRGFPSEGILLGKRYPFRHTNYFPRIQHE